MIQFNFNCYPKQEISKLFNGYKQDSVFVDDAKSILMDSIKLDNPFEEIKLKRQLNNTIELFKATKVRIKK